MHQFFLWAWFFALVSGRIVKDYENIDLGQCLPASRDKIINCPILNFECRNQSAKSGAIVSPNLPQKVTNESFFGKYRLFIHTCFSTTVLVIKKNNFMLGAPKNSFTVGNGKEVDTVSGEIIRPPLIWEDSEQIFQMNNDTLVYESNSNSIWIEIDVSDGFFWFNIYYYIFTTKEVRFIEEDFVTSDGTDDGDTAGTNTDDADTTTAFSSPNTDTSSTTINTNTGTTSTPFNPNTDTTSTPFNPNTDTTSTTFNPNTVTTSTPFSPNTDTTSTTFNPNTDTTSTPFNTNTGTTSTTFNPYTDTTSTTFNPYTDTTSTTFNTNTDTTSTTVPTTLSCNTPTTSSTSNTNTPTTTSSCTTPTTTPTSTTVPTTDTTTPTTTPTSTIDTSTPTTTLTCSADTSTSTTSTSNTNTPTTTSSCTTPTTTSTSTPAPTTDTTSTTTPTSTTDTAAPTTTLTCSTDTTTSTTSTSSTNTPSTASPCTTGSTTSTSTSTTTTPITIPTTTTPRTTSTTTPTPSFQEPCDQNDPYGVNWKTFKNETMEKNCSVGVPGAFGTAFWKCNCINNRCKFETSQPDFTGCQSSGLVDIKESINNNQSNVTEIWEDIKDLTKSSEYYGQEIVEILANAFEALLDRMQREIDVEENPDLSYFLNVQINSSELATESIDHLISNEAQWKQLIDQEKGNEEILQVLDILNDIAFRLSNVSKQAEVPLIYEYSFANVTISSSYWNGTQGSLYNFNSKNATSHLASLRFPARKEDHGMESILSYIELPKDIVKTPFKSVGVYIAASELIQLLLPGSDNIERLNYKEVNSPLISYTLYNPEAKFFNEEAPLPNDSYVQLVFRHEVNAKYPSFRTLRRSRDYEGEESTVMDSSICSFLSKNEDVNNNSWVWRNKGCRVLSTNSTHTICKCTHLTGFANLMDFHDFAGRSVVLDTTSMTCSILSIIGLVSTFCILLIFRNLKMKRTFLTQNLCITLMISYLLIWLTLDKRFLGLNEVTCATMGILLHYMLLTSFMWMLIEGFQLYRVVVAVFGTKKSSIYYALVAYTVPFFIVGITVLIANSYESKEFIRVNTTVILTGIMQAYSGDETCWLVGPWIWAFNGPVAVIIVANCRFLVAGVGASCKSNRGSKRNPKKLIRGAIFLTFLLGLTWVFGFLLFSDLIVFPFIFTIANGLQGVVIFIERCILTKKIRKEIIGNLKRFPAYLNDWSRNTLTTSELTGQSSLQNSFSNKLEANYYIKTTNDSTAEIIPRIQLQSFKTSSFNT